MARIEEPDATPPTDASVSSQSGQGHPRLRPVTDEEQAQAEGVTELTWIALPPDADE